MVRAICIPVILAASLLTGSPETLHGEPTPFEQYKDVAPRVDSAPVLQIYVTLSEKVSVGQTDKGARFIVPITGGHFTGEEIRGEVVPGGADWQLVRSDGVKEIVARYSIRTDDGQVIMVDNRGISREDGNGQYRLTAPKFHAPEGDYDWLNKTLFVGTITSIAEPRAVVIRVYRLH